MSRPPAPRPEPDPSSAPVSFGQALRRYFLTGLATLFPVAVTSFLIWKIFEFSDGLLGNLLGFQRAGLGLLVTILVILVVGVLSIHFFGRLVFRTVELAFARLPIVRKIYPAVKQLTQFLFSEESRNAAFRRVVLVQFPRTGLYSVAFVLNEAKPSVAGKPQTLLTLLIPNPPSPFTGPIIFAPEEDVIPLNLSVEEAVKLIVSGGVVASPLQAAPK